MKLATDIRPITFMKTRAAELVDSVADSGRTVVITQNGRARAVVVGAQTYQAWQDALALLRIASMGEADVAKGRLSSQTRVFGKLRARLRRRG